MAKKVTVIKPSSDQLKELDVDHWSPWSCEVSEFDWEYDGTETCYVLKGKVTVETDDGAVEFAAGDLVQFKDGLKCRWKVTEPIRKVYSFDVEEL